MLVEARFLYATCQVGAEVALKQEVALQWPSFRPAFSRPGFVTFKLPDNTHWADDFHLNCTLARTSGFCLGKVVVEQAQQGAADIRSMIGQLPFDHLHVWERDAALPGDRGFEPGITPLASEIGKVLSEALANGDQQSSSMPLNQIARAENRILDCVVVEPNEWWLGWHVVTEVPTSWPGGVPPFQTVSKGASRAYLKMLEALAWSEFPVKRGDRCAEIGCAPGGAAQALLEKEAWVLGIDPAEVDPDILAHPQFTHARKRVAEVKRREFRDIKWLFCDSNINPSDSLDDLEAIVTHREVRVRGLLVTLKLSDWSTFERLPSFVERVRSWGFPQVRTRQLAFNRHEVCLAASKTR